MTYVDKDHLSSSSHTQMYNFHCFCHMVLRVYTFHIFHIQSILHIVHLDMILKYIHENKITRNNRRVLNVSNLDETQWITVRTKSLHFLPKKGGVNSAKQNYGRVCCNLRNRNLLIRHCHHDVFLISWGENYILFWYVYREYRLNYDVNEGLNINTWFLFKFW